MLGNDGPNVNKTVANLFKEKFKELKLKSFVDIGTCNINVVHNAFKNTMSCLSVDVSDFIVKIYYYFHHHDARKEAYEDIQNTLNVAPNVFIIYAISRWLSTGLAADRADE